MAIMQPPPLPTVGQPGNDPFGLGLFGYPGSSGSNPSAGGSGSGILQGIGKAAQNLSPVLGGAAGSQAAGEETQAGIDLRAQAQNAAVPGTRLHNALLASLASNAQPYTANWGGPGSGLKGQVVNFAGGPNLKNLPADVRSLAQSVMSDELNQQLAGPIHPQIGSSTGDKVLGGAATGAGILGALLPLFMAL